MILEIDVQGAANVRQLGLEATSIFILPPSFAVLRERLTERGTESAEQLALRLANARREVLDYEYFDYVVVNDDLARATGQLQAVIEAERARCNRQRETINKILATFGSN